MMIGIIVPVYNTQKYIAECIESILAQTYTKFRLILVDDGSPDNAGAICNEYAAKDSRITVIHQENAGVTRARARGVEEANDCEWITFVDSDDLLPEYALEILHSNIDESTDISRGAMKRFSKKEDIVENSKNKNTYINIDILRKRAINGTDSNLWAKLIKRDLFDSNTFDIPKEIIMGEDTITNVKIAFKTNNKAAHTTKIVYYYRQHNESCMHTFRHNAEYEQTFLEQLWENVPKEFKNNYINAFIRRRINTYDSFFGYSANVPEWLNTGFLTNLLADIKTYNYYHQPIERILLTAQNKQMRAILILTKRVKNKIMKYL